jgi:hypothetical protein
MKIKDYRENASNTFGIKKMSGEELYFLWLEKKNSPETVLDKKGLTKLHTYIGKALNIPNKDWQEKLAEYLGQEERVILLDGQLDEIQQIIFGGKK